jgi:hypothetical protein
MKNQSKSMENMTPSIESLNQEESKLMKDLERVQEIKHALSILIKYDYNVIKSTSSPKISVLVNRSGSKMNQSGKNTINQAMGTKRKIMKLIKSLNSTSFLNIHESVLKVNDSSYSKNTIRQYLSELTRSKKIRFNKSLKEYSISK